jgi:hypothetical protein
MSIPARLPSAPARAGRAARAARRAAGLCAAAAVLAARPAAAQQPAPPVLPKAPPPAQLPWLQTVSINPVGIVGGIFSAEYEVALPAPGFTLAAGGSIISNAFLVDRDQRWLEGRAMYYPGEVSLRGFAVGVSLGVHSARRENDDAEAVRRRDSGATLGLMGSYNWLVGRQQRLVFGAGAGLKRVLKNVDDETSPLQQVYPDGRILIGFAF